MAGFFTTIPIGFFTSFFQNTGSNLVPTPSFVVKANSSCCAAIFPDLIAGIRQTIGVDFGDFLPADVTLNNPTVSISVVPNEGVDPTPANRVTGGPQIGTIPVADKGTGVEDASILVQLNGLPGVYLVQVIANRSDGSDQVSYFTHITCIEAA